MGPPGWTLPRREAFVTFHRERMDGHGERSLVVVIEGRAAGAGRLTPRGDGVHEIALWLGRSARGRGVDQAALEALAQAARAAGALTVISPAGGPRDPGPG